MIPQRGSSTFICHSTCCRSSSGFLPSSVSLQQPLRSRCARLCAGASCLRPSSHKLPHRATTRVCRWRSAGNRAARALQGSCGQHMLVADDSQGVQPQTLVACDRPTVDHQPYIQSVMPHHFTGSNITHCSRQVGRRCCCSWHRCGGSYYISTAALRMYWAQLRQKPRTARHRLCMQRRVQVRHCSWLHAVVPKPFHPRPISPATVGQGV